MVTGEGWGAQGSTSDREAPSLGLCTLQPSLGAPLASGLPCPPPHRQKRSGHHRGRSLLASPPGGRVHRAWRTSFALCSRLFSPHPRAVPQESLCLTGTRRVPSAWGLEDAAHSRVPALPSLIAFTPHGLPFPVAQASSGPGNKAGSACCMPHPHGHAGNVYFELGRLLWGTLGPAS